MTRLQAAMGAWRLLCNFTPMPEKGGTRVSKPSRMVQTWARNTFEDWGFTDVVVNPDWTVSATRGNRRYLHMWPSGVGGSGRKKMKTVRVKPGRKP